MVVGGGGGGEEKKAEERAGGAGGKSAAHLFKGGRIALRLCNPQAKIVKKEMTRQQGGGGAGGSEKDLKTPWMGRWKDGVVMDGWLFKKGNSRGNWVKRWFKVERNHVISYFSGDPGAMGKKRSSIQIAGDTKAVANDTKGREFTFVMSAAGRDGKLRPYVLAAESALEMTQWMSTISAMAGNKAYAVKELEKPTRISPITDILDQIPARKKAEAEKVKAKKAAKAKAAAMEATPLEDVRV
jgi:hypothetical protein